MRGARTDPVPMVMAIWAERRKARIENSGRASSARAATLTANPALPTNVKAITSVPQKCSMMVARRRTPIEAHSHSTPSITP
jgi:hypothetical protein